MPRLSQQAAIIGVGRIINMGAGAVTLVIMARILPSKEAYGAICQLLVLYMALSTLFSVGLPQTVYYFLPRYEGGEKRGFLTQTITLLMLSGAVMGVGLFLGAGIISSLLNSPLLIQLLKIFAVYPALMMPTMAVESTMLYWERPIAAVFVNAILRLGTLAGLVVPSLLGFTLERTVGIWMGVSALMSVLAIALILSSVRGLPFIWRSDMLRDEWKLVSPLALMSVIGITTGYIDRILVSHTFGAVVFGAYANATMQFPTVTTITNAGTTILNSELCKHSPGEDGMQDIRIWKSAVARTGVLIFISLGFFAFWGHETMRLLFTDRFTDSGAIFSLAIWAIPNHLLMMQPLFLARGALGYGLRFAFMGLLAQVVCVLGIGRLFGIPGIVIGVIAAQYLVSIYSVYWFSERFTSIGWRQFLPWRELIAAFLCAFTAGLFSRIVTLIPWKSWLLVHYILGGLVFLGVYAGALYYVGMGGYLNPKRLGLTRITTQPVVAA